MRRVPVVHHSLAALPEPSGSAGFEDMLMDVRVPAPERKPTPEQLRTYDFHDAAQTRRENFASANPQKYSLSMNDVCRFGGSPPRHTQIGRNCPHGAGKVRRNDE